MAFKTNKTKEAMQRSVTNRLNSYLFRSQKRDGGEKKKERKEMMRRGADGKQGVSIQV